MATVNFNKATKQLKIAFTASDILALEDDIGVSIGEWYQNAVNQVTRHKKKPMAEAMLQKARAENIPVTAIDEASLVIQHAQQPGYLSAKARNIEYTLKDIESNIVTNNRKFSEANTELLSLPTAHPGRIIVQEQINVLEQEAITLVDNHANYVLDLAAEIAHTKALLAEV